MKRQQLLLLILAFGVFSILNTEMGIIGILPMAAEMYQVDIVQAGMLVSLFALGVAIAGPTMPLLFSRFNRKHVMLLVLGVFTICNALAVVASDFQLLLVLRVVPAFFHPVYCALAFSVAAASVAPEDAPRAVARINMGVAAGMVVSVPISNVLAATFDFSVAMAFFAGVTGLMFLLTVAFVPDLPVTQPMRYGAQLSVLKRPPVWLAIVAVICLNGSIFGVYNYLADYLQKVAALPGELIAALLLVYGLLNICGSYLGAISSPGVPARPYAFSRCVPSRSTACSLRAVGSCCLFLRH
ncbi:MFS transporter [Mitsuokella jalaludinii]|uniref:MFS transporter n=1 Tax=Mitsuokella jalaludinii TaxID=187979 RepID=UPI00307C72EF